MEAPESSIHSCWFRRFPISIEAPDEMLQIYIENYVMTSNRLLTLDVKSTDTICSLKVMIRGKIFLSDEQHLLMFNGTNLLGVNCCSTLNENSITNHASLLLCDKGSFQVFLYSRRHGNHFIQVNPLDKLHTLKEKIQECTGVPVGYQSFSCVVTGDKQPRCFPDDEQTLLSYGIFKRLDPEPYCFFTLNPTKYEREWSLMPEFDETSYQFLLEIESADCIDEFIAAGGTLPPLIWPDDEAAIPKVEVVVHIPNMGWEFPLMVKPADSIHTLRFKIWRASVSHDELYGQAYIHDGLYVLIFDGKLLEDDSATLDECGIKKNRDRIVLCEKTPFPIDVHVPDCGLHLRITVRCLDTIRMLKEEIQRQTDIPSDEQHLQYGKEWLVDDGSRLVDYHITKSVEYDKSIVRNPPYDWSRNTLKPAGMPVITLTVVSSRQGRSGVA